ncbi:MAG: hypothetical protein AUK54_09440 [Helicobacteraceae bacterium CG2_30_36_10]|nr:MAG: hypothetical protein AUK54_09440 [Helicobacteraceae bacterium CG2_30_36_10]
MKIVLLIAFYIVILCANEVQYKEGKHLYYDKSCSNCHGTEAEGSGEVPRLANRPKKYLIKKLKDFQNGKSNTQTGQIMFSFARSLNQKDIDDISTYLFKLKEETSDKYKISDDILGSVD